MSENEQLTANEKLRGLRLRRNGHRTLTIGKNHLLAIGIDEYEDDGISDLSNAVRDAKGFIEVLKEKYTFDEDNIKMLFNTDATEAAILAMFRRLIKEVKSIDNLIIYYSGHGYFDNEFDEGYWVTTKASANNAAAYVPNSILTKVVKRINARHILVISDSCFSGSMFTTSRSIAVKREEGYRSRWAFSSGRNEPVSDGSMGGNSPFTSSLINCLKQNNKELLGISEVITVVKEATAANASQTPIGSPLMNVGHQFGEFVFRVRKDERKHWESIKNSKNVADYDYYLQLYGKTGRYARTANIRKMALLETQLSAQLWNEATTKNTIKGYQEYLKHYPKGKTAREAIQKIKLLKREKLEADKKLWEKALEKNTETTYRRFIKRYPDNIYVKNAKLRITEFENKERYEEWLKSYENWLKIIHHAGDIDSYLLLTKKSDYQPSNQTIKQSYQYQTYQYQPEQEQDQSNGFMYNLIDSMIEVQPHIAKQCYDYGFKDEHVNEMEVLQKMISIYPYYPIGHQLQQLVNNPTYSTTSEKRLEELVYTYEVTLKFFVYILLGQLWDEKIRNPRLLITDKFKEVLQDFFNLNENNYSLFNYEEFFVALLSICGGNNIDFFMPETKNISQKELYLEAFLFFKALKKKRNEDFYISKHIKDLCYWAEFHLVSCLSDLAFLINYPLFSVREISLDKERTGKLQYDHVIAELNVEEITEQEEDSQEVPYQVLPVQDHSVNQGYYKMVKQEKAAQKPAASSNLSRGIKIHHVLMEFPLDNHCILLTKGNPGDHTSLNLSPFMIDKSTYEGNQENDVKFCLFAYKKDNEYYYLSDKEIIACGDAENELIKELIDQFKAFEAIILEE